MKVYLALRLAFDLVHSLGNLGLGDLVLEEEAMLGSCGGTHRREFVEYAFS